MSKCSRYAARSTVDEMRPVPGGGAILRQVRVVLAVFLALVAFAGSAAAECAWVLWHGSKTIGKENWDWQPNTAGSQAVCEEKRATELVEFDTPSWTRKRVGDDVVDHLKLGKQAMIRRFVCLPDTVDPRGPKKK